MYEPACALFTRRMLFVQACELLEVTVALPWLDPRPQPGARLQTHSFSFYTWGNGGSESHGDSPKATQLINGKPGLHLRLLFP